MSKKLPHLSVIAAIFALCLMVASPAFAGPSDNTRGNDRKEGYEDNSKTPQETNHGKGSDHDGDADADSSTTDEDDHDTADAGDNRHPSGKDRSVENGGSGNQGNSESNPDDSVGPMRYEGGQGDDKPQGPGGTDRADQDGNNGCGNDDDFDDDNNGWCGRPVEVDDTNTPRCPDGSDMVEGQSCDKPKVCDADETMAGIQDCDKPKVCDADETMAGIQPCDKDEDVVLPDLEIRPSKPQERVLGVRFSQAPAAPQVAAAVQPAAAGALLPFTGMNVNLLLAAALGLIIAGAAALKVRTNN